MAIKKFMDLSIGDKFKLNGINYVKTQEERISCCQVINASQEDLPSTRIQVTPITEVETDIN